MLHFQSLSTEKMRAVLLLGGEWLRVSIFFEKYFVPKIIALTPLALAFYNFTFKIEVVFFLWERRGGGKVCFHYILQFFFLLRRLY